MQSVQQQTHSQDIRNKREMQALVWKLMPDKNI